MGGIILQQAWAGHFYPWMAAEIPYVLDGLKTVLEGIAGRVPGINWEVGPDKFPLDGQWVNFFAMMGAGLFLHALGQILGQGDGSDLQAGGDYYTALMFCFGIMVLATVLYAFSREAKRG